jgi:hypothetical protein
MMVIFPENNTITDPSPPPDLILSPAPKWLGGGDGRSIASLGSNPSPQLQ